MASLRSILLVEDSPLTRRMISAMLHQHGSYDVIEAADGGEALELLDRHMVDVVLSDWHMRPVDGQSLRQSIRRHPRLALIPFVMMTSQHCPDNIRRAVGDLRGHYLTKPFSRHQLYRVLDRAVLSWAA